VRPFVVLFLGRSGSTYFMEALGSHPEIRAGFEELGSRRDGGAEAQLRFAREFFSDPDDATERAAGFKTKLQDVLDRERFASLLREVGAHAVLLQRRNVVKAVVSWFTSEVVNRATGDWNVYDDGAHPGVIEIDPQEFATRLRDYERARDELRQYAVGLERPTLLLYYEDLLAEHDATFAMTLGFLGVSPMAVRGRSVKATPDDLRRAVTNLAELREVAGPGYHHMFDEIAATT
jgi:hypothetical protein